MSRYDEYGYDEYGSSRGTMMVIKKMVYMMVCDHYQDDDEMLR